MPHKQFSKRQYHLPLLFLSTFLSSFWVCDIVHIIYKIREKAKRLREVLLKDVNIIEQCNVVHQLGFIFSGKIALKTTFLKLFSCYEKRLHSPFLPLHRQNKEVWVSGLNQHTANVPNRKVPKVRILLLPHFGSLAQLDQSTTLRTSVSGVRVSHESQHWRFGRVGLLHRS